MIAGGWNEGMCGGGGDDDASDGEKEADTFHIDVLIRCRDQKTLEGIARQIVPFLIEMMPLKREGPFDDPVPSVLDRGTSDNSVIQENDEGSDCGNLSWN